MISVIILSKNNDDTLDTCLDSVVKSLPRNNEIIIVDAHSTDHTPNILAKYRDEIRVVYDKGKGLGMARNLGVRSSHGEILVFVDSDVICSKDYFRKVEKYFDKHKEIAALDTKGAHPKMGTTIQKLASLLQELSEKQFKQPELRGWCISIRRTALLDVGGFWRIGSDDAELSFKLRSKGYRLATIETASYHIPRRTLGAFIKEIRLWARNSAVFHYTHANDTVVLQSYRAKKGWKITHNIRASAILTAASSPLIGVNYLIKSKKPSLYAFFIVRQLAYLSGYMQGNIDIYRQNPRLDGVLF
jgi:glycosyltransferase involved in cell wall biosynthesis